MHSFSSSINDILHEIEEGKCIPEVTVYQIFEKLKEVLIEEPNLLQLTTPINVCGDIHGQVEDLFVLFQIGEPVSTNNYLFLGDYVDRGNFSLNTFLYLACLKIQYPNKIHLLRGNHESNQINHVYGFYDECISRYGNSYIWKEANETLNFLPISAVISGILFCTHGGISPHVPLVEHINTFNRFTMVPNYDCAFSNLLWDDPDSEHNSWEYNPRGIGWNFGERQVLEFLNLNNQKGIIRAHQVIPEGHKNASFSVVKGSPFDFSLVTIWSAPHYMGNTECGACIMKIDNNFGVTYLPFQSNPKKFNPETILPIYFH